MMDPGIFAFECWVRGNEHLPATTYNARTRGKAAAQHFSNCLDCYPDLKFTDVRVRKVGGPVTSERFRENARYRGMPDLKCGMRVAVGGQLGAVVGHNSSANLDILFDDVPSNRWRGRTLNVHPAEVVVVA